MSELVADSCVVIKWLVDEPGTAGADKVLDAYSAGSLRLLAPDLMDPEISNVLWKKVRRNLLTLEKAWQAFEIFRRYRFTVTPAGELLADAMQIAFDYDQSPYDCLYVALSHRAGCSLVTTDEKLVRNVGHAFPQVVLLTA